MSSLRAKTDASKDNGDKVKQEIVGVAKSKGLELKFFA